MKNRVIKFRAWHRGYKPSGLRRGTEPGMIYADKASDALKWKEDGQPIDVMQFTGITDKNGKDIYEGDIVECHLNGRKLGNVDKVEFKKGSFILGYRTVSLAMWESMPDDTYTGDLVVLGNIYENPELLAP